MRLTRFMASVLFGLLLAWGGIAIPNAQVAFAHEFAAVVADDAEKALPNCAADAARHEHDERQGNPTKPVHQGCCVMACGMSVLEPTILQVAPIEWTLARVQIVIDDMLRDRFVSPLRRPPRLAA